MKRWILIVLILLVAAAHFLIFFVDWGGDDKVSPESGEIVEEKSGSNPVDPIRDSEQPPSTQDVETKKRIAATVERMKSKAPTKDSVSTPLESESPPPPPGEEIPEGAMKVGLVEGTASLPADLADLAEKGTLAVAAEDWEGARGHFLEMVKAAPDNALAYANLGVAEHQLGNLLAASGNLRKSLELNPSIAQNWQTLGIIHLERGELELAISSLTRAIHEEPSDARSRVYLAAVLREYGWMEASVIELQRAIETDPSLADAHFNLALTYLDNDPPRIELAKRHYYAAIDLGIPMDPEVERYFSQGEREEEGSPAKNEGTDDF